MTRRTLLWAMMMLVGLAVLLPAISGWAKEGLSAEQMKGMLEELDERQRNAGDFKALVFIEQKEKGKADLVYESVIYRRDETDKLMILFLKPKAEAGKGYLRLDRNLFMYDPNVGKWERRTERERIGGTSSQRGDYDESRLAQEFVPRYAGAEKLGKISVHHLELKAREGVDVAYPVVHLWIDEETGNLLKRQDFALSGRLMRTSYYPKWRKIYSESKKGHVYFPKQIRIYDEVEKGNNTTMVFRSVTLKDLPENIFTKAWLESKSR